MLDIILDNWYRECPTEGCPRQIVKVLVCSGKQNLMHKGLPFQSVSYASCQLFCDCWHVGTVQCVRILCHAWRIRSGCCRILLLHCQWACPSRADPCKCNRGATICHTTWKQIQQPDCRVLFSIDLSGFPVNLSGSGHVKTALFHPWLQKKTCCWVYAV